MSWTPSSPADYPIAGTASAGAAAAQLVASGQGGDIEQIVLQADPANGANVLVGNVTVQPIVLTPGTAITIPCSNAAGLYHKSAGAPGQNLHYLGIS